MPNQLQDTSIHLVAKRVTVGAASHVQGVASVGAFTGHECGLTKYWLSEGEILEAMCQRPINKALPAFPVTESRDIWGLLPCAQHPSINLSPI